MNCATCTNWQPRESIMARQGLAPCAKGSAWTYLPPSHECRVNLHKQADEKTVNARSVWLAKMAGGRT